MDGANDKNIQKNVLMRSVTDKNQAKMNKCQELKDKFRLLDLFGS